MALRDWWPWTPPKPRHTVRLELTPVRDRLAREKESREMQHLLKRLDAELTTLRLGHGDGNDTPSA